MGNEKGVNMNMFIRIAALGILGISAKICDVLRITRRSCVFLGMQASGKTTLLNMLMNGPKYEKPQATRGVSENEESEELYLSKPNNIKLWELSHTIDFAGDEIFQKSYAGSIRGKDCVIFMFDASKYITEENYRNYAQARLYLTARYIDNDKQKFYVIGTHIDEISSISPDQIYHEIQKSLDGKDYAKKIKPNNLQVISLKDYNLDVDKMIRKLILIDLFGINKKEAME